MQSRATTTTTSLPYKCNLCCSPWKTLTILNSQSIPIVPKEHSRIAQQVLGFWVFLMAFIYFVLYCLQSYFRSWKLYFPLLILSFTIWQIMVCIVLNRTEIVMFFCCCCCSTNSTCIQPVVLPFKLLSGTWAQAHRSVYRGEPAHQLEPTGAQTRHNPDPSKQRRGPDDSGASGQTAETAHFGSNTLTFFWIGCHTHPWQCYRH